MTRPFSLPESADSAIVNRIIKHFMKLRGKGDYLDTIKFLRENIWLLNIHGSDRPEQDVIKGMIKCVRKCEFETLQLALHLRRSPIYSLFSGNEWLLLQNYMGISDRTLKNHKFPPFSQWPDQALADLWETSLEQFRKSRQRLGLKKPKTGPQDFKDFVVQRKSGRILIQFTQQ